VNSTANNSARHYAAAALIITACTLLAAFMFPLFAPANLIMVYLVGVLIVAKYYGRGPSILASVLSVGAFDFFFVPPYLTFAVADTEYLITFAVMLLVALTISSLTAQIRQQAAAAQTRERRTASLYTLSRELANTLGTDALLDAAMRHLTEVFDGQPVLLLPDKHDEHSGLIAHVPKTSRLPLQAQALDTHEQGIARWVYDNRQPAGIGTDTLPSARGLYLPLLTLQGISGVLGLYAPQPEQVLSADQRALLETFANQIALAVEHARLSDEAEHTRLAIETERLRNALLSSVSHDLRTPLASITGAVSSLLESELDPASRRELAQIAYEEAEHMNRLISNLLDMTRLESGSLTAHKEWQPLEEVVGTAIARLEKQLGAHALKTVIPFDLPLVPLDSVLIEQVLLNLLENAIKYAPSGSSLTLSAHADQAKVTVDVADRGPGLPAGSEQRIFDKFYRAQLTSAPGIGLGLTICRGIVEAHGGHIWAENQPGGGAVFRFTLPLDGSPPAIDRESQER